MTEPILEVRGVTKTFGGITALRNIDLELYPHEILALLGDNGAGKSTLIKIICGAYQADEGEVYLEGKRVVINRPKDAKNLGIETIYQDLALFDTLDVTTNLFIAREITGRFRFLNRKRMNKETDEIVRRLGIRVGSVKQRVGNLSGGQRHAIAITRAVYISENSRILLMDEPTAGLGVEESRKLLKLTEDLKAKGMAVILITHNLDHVFAIADRAVVLRSSERVGERKIQETNTRELIEMMIGGSNSKTG